MYKYFKKRSNSNSNINYGERISLAAHGLAASKSRHSGPWRRTEGMAQKNQAKENYRRRHGAVRESSVTKRLDPAVGVVVQQAHNLAWNE